MGKPIACTLVAVDRDLQGRRWRDVAERTSVERLELPNGLRLVFGAEPGVPQELEELVATERECCAFADWTLTHRGGRVTLDITATGGAVPVVQGMFA